MITVDTHTKVHSRSSSPAFGNAMLQAVPSSEVYLMDCIQGMKHYPDKWFDLAIVDPPYGIGGFTQSETKKYGNYKWNEQPPTKEYFNELNRVSKQRIIWGANYYNCFEGGNAAIIWNKQNPHPSLSSCEIASVSWGKRIVYYEYQWHGLGMHTKRSGFHPCEKPISLYDFCFDFAKVEAGMKVLDTHLGSQSSRISANKYQLNFVGFETDEEYFNKGNKRYDDFVSQTRLF